VTPATLGIAAALVGALAYGINIPAARAAGQMGVAGPALIAVRGIVLIAALALFARLAGWSLAVPQGARARLFLFGCTGAATALCYLSSLGFVPVAVAVTLFYTFPLWLILIAPLAGTGALTAGRLAVFAIAFAGILMCVGPNFGALDWRGIAFALAASIACAALFQLTPTVRAGRFPLVFWSQAVVTAVAVPWTLLSGAPSAATLGAAALPIAISALGFYAGFALQIIAAMRVAPATVGLIFLIEPVVAIALAALVLGETLTPLQMAGIATVIGVLAVDLGVRQRPAREPIHAA
jgi:drug/metabolite transporter (DMT)-like permease